MGELILAIAAAAAGYLQRPLRQDLRLRSAWTFTTLLGLALTVMAVTGAGERAVLALARWMEEVQP